jgi:hypothetical protein
MRLRQSGSHEPRSRLSREGPHRAEGSHEFHPRARIARTRLVIESATLESWIDSLTLALVAYVPAVIFGAMWLGSVLAITQAMVKLRMRAMASAILFLVLNLIGLGLGPQLVGILGKHIEWAETSSP